MMIEEVAQRLDKPRPLLLTPLELIDRFAAPVPPPRIRRHRYFGVLAPNSPLRAAVTVVALAATTPLPAPDPEPAADGEHDTSADPALPPTRGHHGVSGHAKVQRQACRAVRCHRKSALDPYHPPLPLWLA
jgi:hypothetical protein